MGKITKFQVGNEHFVEKRIKEQNSLVVLAGGILDLREKWGLFKNDNNVIVQVMFTYNNVRVVLSERRASSNTFNLLHRHQERFITPRNFRIPSKTMASMKPCSHLYS